MSVSTPDTVNDVVSSGTFERLARAGYVARGVIYVLMGVLAIQLARGVGGDNQDQEGALRLIADQAFGRVLLAIVALGWVWLRFVRPRLASAEVAE